MSFECGFEVLPKLNKDTTFKEAIKASKIIEYEMNDWAKENYSSFDEYLKRDEELYSLLNDIAVSDEVLDFYKEHESDTLEYWCSNGRIFDNEVITYLSDEYKELENYILDKDSIQLIKEYINNTLSDFEIIPIYPTMALNEIDEGYILQPLEGIQYEDEEGNIGQIFNEEDTKIFTVKNKNLTFEDYITFNSLNDVIKKIEDIDLDNNFIIYYRSY